MQKACSKPQPIPTTDCTAPFAGDVHPQWTLQQFLFSHSGKRQPEERQEKEQRREWSGRHKYFTWALPRCPGAGGPKLQAQFCWGRKWFLFKRVLSLAPGVQHPSAAMTFRWQMVQIAWHAPCLLDQNKDKSCQMAATSLAGAQGWAEGGAELPKVQEQHLKFLWSTLELQLTLCWAGLCSRAGSSPSQVILSFFLSFSLHAPVAPHLQVLQVCAGCSGWRCCSEPQEFPRGSCSSDLLWGIPFPAPGPSRSRSWVRAIPECLHSPPVFGTVQSSQP